MAVAWDVKPVVGLTKRNFLVLANKAPHPNAAKLFIRWILGDEQGGAGMEPWFVPGGWPSRSDVKPPVDTTLDDLKAYTWFLDPEFIYDYGLEVRDFWLGL